MTTIIVDGDNQDKILIQRNTDSFSIDAGKSMETIQDTDYILVQRGEESYRVSGAIAKDDLGTKGEIQEPVAVISPENGAGMGPENVYPAAEGITGLVESTVIAPTYSSTLTVEVGNADGGTTAVNAFDGDTAKEFRGTIASTMVWDASSYGITVANSLKIHTLSLKGSGDSNVAISINGAVLHNTNTSDQNTNYGTAGTVNIPFTGDLNEVRFVATGSAGTYFYAIYVDDEVLIDGGVTNNATLTYTTDNNLDLLTEGQSMTQSSAYTPVTDTINSITSSPASTAGRVGSVNSEDRTTLTSSSSFYNYTVGQAFNTSGVYPGGSLIVHVAGGAPWVFGKDTKIDPSEALRYEESDDGVNWGPTIFWRGDDSNLTINKDWVRISAYSMPSDSWFAFNLTVWKVVSTSPKTTLTFNSPKDLENFRPGDAIYSEESAWEARYIPSSSLTTTPIEGMTDEVFYSFPPSPQTSNSVAYSTSPPSSIPQSQYFPNFTGAQAGWLVIKLGEVTASGTMKTNTGAGSIYITYSNDGVVWTTPVETTGLANGNILLPTGTKWAAQWRGVNQDYYINPVSAEFRATNNVQNAEIVSIIPDDSKMIVGGGTWANGDTITGPVSQGTGKYVSKDDTTLELTNVGGRWCVDDQNVGLAAVSDTQYTILAPDPNEIVFQSANGEPLTTTFSGENCVLRDITWTLGVSETGEAGTYVETEYKEAVAIPVNIEVPRWDGPPDGLANDTYYSLKVKYEADSRAEIVESNTIYFKTGSGDEPQDVKMSGLRFDPDRNTYLSNSSISFGTKWTFSAWIKYTNGPGKSSITWLFSDNASGSPDASNEGLRIMPSDSKLYYYNDSGQLLLSNTRIEQNVWTHVVVSLSGNRMLAHINGGEDVNNIGQTVSLDGIAIGRWDDSNILNGYLSDVYFVEDQVLDASAFGKDYDGLWGPIPSETILNNITRNKSPYDQRPLMENRWSDSAVSNGPQPWTGAFDGVINSTYNTNEATSNTNETPVEWSYAGDDLTFSKIEVWAAKDYRSDSETGRLIVNGKDVSDQLKDTVYGWYELDLSGAADETKLKTVSMTGYGSGLMRLGAIKLDGRILVDGPADNSRNWSDSFTCADGFNDTNTAEKAFDGDTSTRASTSSTGVTKQTPMILDLSSNPIENVTSVSAFNQGDFIINDEQKDTSNNETEKTVTYDPPITLTSIKFRPPSTSTGASVLWMKVNGKILIDSGDQWDTSQIWSDLIQGDVLTTSGSPGTALFDGNIGPGFANGVTAATGNTLLLDFGTTFEEAFTVTIYGYTGSDQNDQVLKINGTSVDIPPYGTSSDRSVTFNLPQAGLQTIEWTYVNGNSYMYMQAIEVDGVMLVDTGSLGSNGFYLPFDPAQEGVNYTNSATFVNSTGDPVVDPHKLFDGDTSTTPQGSSENPSNIRCTFNTPITGFNTVKILSSAGSDQFAQRKVFYEGNVGRKEITTPGLFDITSELGGVLNYVEYGNYGGTDVNRPPSGCQGIYVDGKLLVDHNSIGVDASGNGNDFHDENFAVGNTSQVWSTGGGTDNDQTLVTKRMFDGSLNTYVASRPENTVITLGDGVTGVVANNSVRFYGSSQESSSAFWTINGFQTNAKPLEYVNDNTFGWSSVTDNIFPITITSVGLSGPGPGAGSRFVAVEIDGQLLIDANIQDTVVDTPVKSYAVLSSSHLQQASDRLSNGNLEINLTATSIYGVSSIPMKVNTGKYYVEVYLGNGRCLVGPANAGTDPTSTGNFWYDAQPNSIVGVIFDSDERIPYFYSNGVFQASQTQGAAFDNNFAVAGKAGEPSDVQVVVNFGQQPFVAPNVTHDLEAGTVEVIDDSFNEVACKTLYTELEGYQVAGGYFYDEKNQQAVRGSDLRKRFGRDTANEQLGIYELTEVPSHQVIGYEKVEGKYQPLRDYTPEVRVAQAETAAAEAQADQYLNYLKAAATAWAVGRIFNEGDIIEFNGKLYRALNNMTATADNDPADDTADWEDLGINS